MTRPMTAPTLALLLLMATAAAAQDWLRLAAGAAGARTPGPRTPAETVYDGPIDPGSYILGPGDQLAALVYNLERSELELPVESDGRLRVEGLGRYPAAGRSLARLQAELEPELARFWGGDSASLWIHEPRPIRVRLGGWGLHEATLELRYLDRLSEALAAAEPRDEPDLSPATGLEPPPSLAAALPEDGPSLRRVLIVRGADTLDVDHLAGLRAVDPAGNPRLESGDRVLVRRRGPVIWTSGPFAHGDGPLEHRPGDTPGRVYELLGGSLEPGPAILELARMSQGELRLERLEPGDPRRESLRLEPGDRLYLRTARQPEPVAEVGVDGEVLRPGRYPIRAGHTTLAELLAWAEPDPSRADSLAVIVHREPGDDTELDYLAEVLRIRGLEKYEHDYLKSRLVHRGGRLSVEIDRRYLDAGRIVLRDGDRIEVPRQEHEIELVGAVQRPGRLPWQPGRTVGEYIEAAGGRLKGSYLAQAKVRSRSSGHFAPLQRHQVLEPGDIVIIPYRDELTAWEKFKEGLTVTSQLLTIVLVSRSF
jgi:protein involved in polysaccharide export with SLBB domain